MIVSYVAIGYFLHLVVFRENKPDISTYFKPGQVFYCREEGVRQTVAKQENGLVYCHLEFYPYSPGPPKHIHTTFDETFETENGELSVWINGEVKKVRPGESLTVRKGTAHQPFNNTPHTVRLKGTIPFPEKFAFGLVQVYGLMDSYPDFGKNIPKTMLMMAPICQSGFDSCLAEGPPVFIQKLTWFLLTPIARLMGYKSYYKEYDPS
ncbi:MAG: cupin domain-containing protein [Bacteroidetes bacterium]|nr:MAG: cupin domain-containing protein [Bacteroidota bacterium]